MENEVDNLAAELCARAGMMLEDVSAQAVIVEPLSADDRSRLIPRIVEAIAAGTQQRSVSRRSLLSITLLIDWAEQEQLFGLAS